MTKKDRISDLTIVKAKEDKVKSLFDLISYS